MNMVQLRQKIDHQLNSLSPQWLVLISNFLDSIQTLTLSGAENFSESHGGQPRRSK